MLLKDRVALVTGAAQGLGRGIAQALAEEGAAVAVTDIQQDGGAETATMVEKLGVRASAVTMDVTSEASVAQTLEAVVREFGRLDVLVNNAGVIKMNPFLDISATDYVATFDVNVKGVLLCSQLAAKQMMRQDGGGAIVNIASNAGKVGYPSMADYNASKAAIISLTRSMAAELAPHINVNAVCPGGVRTDMLRDVADWLAERSGEDPESLLQNFPPEQLGRLIEPVEVGRVVAFLASERAHIIRGQAINVDGGETPY